MKTFLNLLCFVALIASSSLALRAATPATDTTTAALIVTPDRGFLGNEEIRDACDAFAAGRPAEIVTVTDERTRDTLGRAVDRLRAAGARKFVVLPLFLSASDPKWALARKYLGELPTDSVSFGQLFGQSYLAAEILTDRFRAIHDPAGRAVLVVGYGATDAESRRQLEADGQRLADLAAQGFGFKSVQAIVWPRRSPSQSSDLVSDVKRALTASAQAGERVAVVPFALGAKLDRMMNFNASLRSQLPAGVELIEGDLTPHPAVSTWMAREWNRGTPLRPEDFGFVFLAHGADYHWNETMRDNIAPLAERHKIEFAFSMADQPTIERAVRRLEQRGARAITIVRVFGLAASFKAEVERMIGADAERGLASTSVSAANAARHGHGSHSAPQVSAGHGHGGHHGPAAGSPPRIRSSALLTTGGGMEDHPTFAQALLERAKALSKDPSRETVILVAHGAGDDPSNDHWRRLLASLAEQMRARGGANFRAIQSGTWREDWPDKREPEIAAIRKLVADASRAGGRAIVIPARMQGRGDEQTLLKDLTFELGTGFAPHPLFARWFEEKIQEGILALRAVQTSAGVPAPEICGSDSVSSVPTMTARSAASRQP